MQRVDLKVYAKINLSLNIVGTKGNMHLLDSVLASVNVYDAISISTRSDNQVNVMFSDSPPARTGIKDNGKKGIKDNEKINIKDNGKKDIKDDGKKEIKTNGIIDIEDNSAVSAVRAIKKQLKDIDAAFDFGVDINIEKGIPIGGGMGGSSADAAGVIASLDRLLGLSERGVDIKKAASETGSDTVYMLRGGYARMRGMGQLVERIESDLELNLVLATPESMSLTGAVYREFDKIYAEGKFCSSDIEKQIDALRSGDEKKVLECAGNALMEPATKLCGEIAVLLERMKELTEKPFMTGSGSTVVGVFESEKAAKEAAKSLKEAGYKATVAKTIPKGIQFL